LSVNISKLLYDHKFFFLIQDIAIEIVRIMSQFSFYRAMHFSAKRGIAIACRLSVCPSVRPSVRPSVCNVGEL